MKKLSRVASIVSSVPWAIEPRALDFIASVVDSHMAGEIPSDIEQNREMAKPQAGIAVVPVQGPIIPRASLMSNLSGATSSEEVAAAVAMAAADDSVKAILLDIDSPGGSVLGGFEAADAIYAARQKKMVVASINGLGASLAYLFASQADMVFASRGSHVGSIGVIARHYEDKAATHNAGYEEITVATSREKAMSGMTKEEITARMRSEVERYFGMFKAAVARGRKVDMEKVATGEMWMAEEAMERGLLDGIYTRNEVVKNLLENLMLT